MTTQPEALRLAQHINDLFVSQWGMNSPTAKDSKIVLDELRRLHTRNQEFLKALEGVSLMSRCGQLDEFIGEPWLNAVHAAIAKAERTTT